VREILLLWSYLPDWL